MPTLDLIRCPACDTVNRVPHEKIEQGLKPICGQCKNRLPVSDSPTVITDATFASAVENSKIPVLLDMWAPWCGPCRMVAPILEQLAGELSGRVQIAKMNVDDNPVTSSRFNVRSIPTLLIFQNGREVDRIVGVSPKPEILRRLQPFL